MAATGPQVVLDAIELPAEPQRRQRRHKPRKTGTPRGAKDGNFASQVVSGSLIRTPSRPFVNLLCSASQKDGEFVSQE